MTIVDLLKDEDAQARVSIGWRWLVWDNLAASWQVLERQPYQKKTRIVAFTPSEKDAVKALMDQQLFEDD